MALRVPTAILLCFAILPPAFYLGRARLSPSCRCFPGEPCWPSPEQWDNLNASLSGNLIATVPIGSVCHTNTSFAPYSSRRCAELQSYWSIPATHYQDPSSPMAAWWANFSCSPFTAGCTLGPLAHYTANVTCASDIREVLDFTTRHNIRLSIRNTGHDYLGKSTAPGSIALWTHNLKSIEYQPNYTTSWYTGPALRVGAGVQGREAQDAAHRAGNGHVIVSAHSPDIGFAGGYTQGGGHGPLASRYGLAADQVLEWEVVTAKGEMLTASPAQNADLYWALAGGGGGAFAIVLGMTVRVHPEEQTASASLVFPFDAADAQAWEVIRTFLLGTLPLADAGGTALWVLFPGPTAATFIGGPFVLPGAGAEELQSYLAPTLQLLREYEMGYDFSINTYPTYHASVATAAVNVTEFHVGGALIPRSTIHSTPTGFISTLQEILRQKAAVSCYSMNVSRSTNSPVSANAVNPAWRNAAVSLLLGIPFNYTDRQVNVENQKLMTDVLLPKVSALVGPDKQGAYLNEADFNQPNWQDLFYGENYNRLLKTKQKYDPKQIFYGRTAVGSERWAEHGDGRLCPV
ncbi:hypothetical protein BDW74DRAFT_188831 [Aspergillus multicolor]|uniref:FAD-dependent oxidoreductase n=1 Tax=Aspergillus multicolor TaxID=41759 RepID=UPI003CCCEA54